MAKKKPAKAKPKITKKLMKDTFELVKRYGGIDNLMKFLQDAKKSLEDVDAIMEEMQIISDRTEGRAMEKATKKHKKL